LAQNLLPEQIKLAINWQTATYNSEVSKQLGLDAKP
jgi:hypothetical protein